MNPNLDIVNLNNQIATLFDNGLKIYTDFAGRIAATKLTLKETEQKIAAIDSPKPVTPQIFGIDQPVFLMGAAALLVVVLIVTRSK